jgi:chromosome segregation ATPase
MKAQDVRHREEVSRIVTEGQERITTVEGGVEPLKAQLAEAHDRLRTERHRHKEELARVEIELKSSIHRAEERLRDAEERLREAEEEVDGLKQVELEHIANRQLPGRNLTRLLPKRPIQTARLAKLWVEHALDRDDQ